MSRDWKPGDVAIATVRGKANVRVTRTASRRGLWFSAESSGPYPDGVGAIRWHADDQVADARPLVVIDPEDREHVERLTGCLAISGANPNDRNYWRETQAALREFADPKPPKPDEPQGLGAVVEDEDGDLWIRFISVESEGWLRAGWGDRSSGIYADIAAVRVLSVGVQP